VRPGLLRGGALLAALTIAAYLPVAHAAYVWDDGAHVRDNPALRDVSGLIAVWTTLDATPQYYPLTHTTFWIEYHLWGLAPLGYHVDNVLLHAVSAILFWRLLALLDVPGALLAACLFAVHPVHVESVAWITERKNTLSAALALGGAHVFLRWALRDVRSPRPAILAGALHVAALLAKTVVAPVPIVLAGIVWWKRGRIARREATWLLTMLAIGAALGTVTRNLEVTQLHAEGADWSLRFWDRVVLAGRVPWFYAGKLAWPSRLTFVYPRWAIDAARPAAWIWLAAGLAVAGAAALAARRSRPGMLLALGAFVTLLAPASGFFDVYPMRFSFVADHFVYLGSLPLLALIAAAGASVPARRPAVGTAVVAVAVLATLAQARCRAFRDEETLWRDTLRKNPQAWIAHNDLGILLARRGEVAEAVEEFRAVLALRPDHAGARANLGYALEILGRDAEAADALAEAAGRAPDDAGVRSHLARTLVRLGRFDAALPQALAAARLAPDDPEAACDAGSLLARAGRLDEGIAELTRALALRPDFPRARTNLEIARSRRDALSSGAHGTANGSEDGR